MIWAEHKAQLARGREHFLIEDLEESEIKHSSCELSLGPEVFVTAPGNRLKKRLEEKQQVEIPPGQFAALLTEERIDIPTHAIAFISIKARVKLRGLVNVSGFHVDPGFRGRLVFSVYNAGSESIVLTRGQKLFPIWFASLTGEDKKAYDRQTGTHFGQDSIPDDVVVGMMGEVASPAALKKELEDLRRSLTQAKAIGAAIVGAILAALATKWLG